MLARDLISNDVPPLKVSDDSRKALEWMDDFKVTHLPVVDKTSYVGIVADTELLDLNSPTDTIGKIRRALTKPFVFEYQHAYDVLKLYASAKISVIPVLDAKERYVGVITHNQLLNYFSELTAAQEPGSLIVLELNQRDYSLTQIAQIAESNNAKIISLFLTPNPDSTLVEVTIKINLQNAQPVLQTLERFGYLIKASFSQSNENKNLQDRYDSLMHYLNI
jgi:predicted transcriptional regulator